MTEPAPTEPTTQQPGFPPRWKFAIVILLGLYPLLIIVLPVMGRIFDTPYLGVPITVGPEFLIRTLVTVLIVVPLMIWVAVPLLMRVFRGWLQS